MRPHRTSSDAKELLTVQRSTPEGDAWLGFREPLDTPQEAFRERVEQGLYGRPFLVDTLEHRSLCFSLDGSVQSEMRLDDPSVLVSSYTQKMMGFLLFHPDPASVLMIGLGGGSLAKFCHRHLTGSRLTVVEIDADVIALRSHFHIPPDDAQLQVINGDGAAYVASLARSGQRVDVMLVDAFDSGGIASSVVEPRFLEDARTALSSRGVFVMNLVAEPRGYQRYVERIAQIFGGEINTVWCADSGNAVVFAGGALQDCACLAAVRRNARHIEATLGLSFPTLLRLTAASLSHHGGRAAPLEESPYDEWRP